MKKLLLTLILFIGFTTFSQAQSLQSLAKNTALLKTPTTGTLKAKIPNGIVPKKVAVKSTKPQRGGTYGGGGYGGGNNPNVNISVGGVNDTKIIREEIAISNEVIRQEMADNKSELLQELYTTEGNIRNDIAQGQAQTNAELQNTKAALEQAIRDNQLALEQQLAALNASKQRMTAAQRKLLAETQQQKAEMEALLAQKNSALEQGLLTNRLAILENQNLIHISVVLGIIILTILAMRFFTRND